MTQKFLAACVCVLLTLSSNALWSQTAEPKLVQFSGMVLDGANEELVPIPYVNILVKDKNRGTYSEFNGFFFAGGRAG